MQILLFVVTVLMLLSLLTYARLDSYLGFVLTRNQLENYMTVTEREFFNLRNIKWYDDTPATKKEADEAKGKKAAATSKVNIYALLNKEEKEGEFDLYNQTRYVIKRIVESLYGNARFYKEISAKRQDFINEILDAMEAAAKKLPKEQAITTPKDLANLDLGDKQLNEAFYLILKGTKRDDSRCVAVKKIKDKQESNDIEETPVDDGYLSLLDFITIDKSRPKLRVFLAPKKVLLAITGNRELTSEILEMRNELFKQVDGGTVSAEDASKQFEQLFSNRISSIVTNAMLDYTVSKTNPKSYE